jgi:hypothetical protein
MMVLHKCDIRKCCCPDHLFLGDGEANAQDCVAKGRHPRRGGHRKLTDAQAWHARILYARGLTLGLKNPYSMQRLSGLLGVSQQTIADLLKGNTYQESKKDFPGEIRHLAK